MKTKIFLWLFFGLAIGQAKAQVKDSNADGTKTTLEDQKCCKCPKRKTENILKYNFKNKTIENEKPFKLKNGEIYTIEINNINQNVYKIEINTSDTSFSKPLDFSVYTSFIPSAFESIAKTINSFTYSQVDREELVEELFVDPKMVPNNLIDLSKQGEINETLEANSKSLKLKETSLKQFFKTFSDSVETWTNNLRKASIIDYTPNFDIMTIDRIETLYNKTNKETKKMAEEIDESIKVFEDFTLKYEDDIKKLNLAHIHNKIQTEYTKMKQVLDSLDKLSSDKEKIAFRNKFYDVMNNCKSSYRTMPMQFNEEQTIVKISITPHDTASRLPRYFTTYKIKEEIKMYAGIGPGLYFTSLRDDNYSIQGKPITDTTNNYELIQEKTSKNEVGVSLLVKAGIKPFKSDIIGFHANLGAGMSLSSSVRPRAMYGLGVSFGRKHNLTIDFGGISGNVNVLSNAFQTGIKYSEKPESVVISKLQTNFYLSLGYLYTF